MPNSVANRWILPILTGPTGAGKTSVVVKFLEKHPEIPVISADSRQIYKFLNIGTDKPSADILGRYDFHLVDFVEPGHRYTAFDFVEDAERIIEEQLAEGRTPIICGGTGLYIKSLIEGIVEIPEDDFIIRERLENEAVEKGPKYLFEELERIDPIEAQKTHPHNIKRIIRALEIFHITGKSKSEIISIAAQKKRQYDFEVICLMPARDRLYDKINRRVDTMMEAGLPKEVKNLYETGLKEAVEKVNIIGYSELFRYFDGEIPLETAVNLIKQNTRRFAKRQITWFTGMDNIKLVTSLSETYRQLEEIWKGRN
nr:tRNA (adenosine(37)-N6)-dimethylallyltransferase MiaA [candidate division Zixibacteria bacterium]